MQIIKYANLYKNISFNLYDEEDINFEYTKEQVLNAFKDKYEKTIKRKLNNIGIKLIGFEYYSPKYYNYEGDDITTIIKVIDKQKLKDKIIKHKNRIKKALDKNVSYDGYIALSVNSVKDEIENLNKANYEPDIIVLRELLNMDLSEFDIEKFDYYYYLEEGEEVD